MAPPPRIRTISGVPQSRRVCHSNGGLQQDELPVAIDKKALHLLIAVAGLQAVSHEDADVAGQFGVAVVDRLVLADEAPQSLGNRARARLELRVLQDLVRLDRPRGADPHQPEGIAPMRGRAASFRRHRRDARAAGTARDAEPQARRSDKRQGAAEPHDQGADPDQT